MEAEKKLSEFVTDTRYEDIPVVTAKFTKELVLGVLGTTVAGATQPDVNPMVKLAREWGGKEEATIFVHGGKVPAYNAAFVNSIMARALDYEDGMPPGVHVGASVIPSALAAAELAGGCSGKEFLAAVALGSEMTAKLSSCSLFDGFDPTGIVSVIGATAAAGRIIGLSSTQMLNALALAFNRSGGSFQCNIDGVLAVTAIQGFASQNAIVCVQLAQRGITGPQNFIEGIYGYLHLYGKDKFSPQDVTKNLGNPFLFHNTVCKKYPSCACTIAGTHAALELLREHRFSPEDVQSVEVRQAPYCYKLVGHEFKTGANPRVDAQFNVQYCVANAILRGGSKLEHFEESKIKDPKVTEFVEKVAVISDSALEEKGVECTLGATIKIVTKSGVYQKLVKDAPGMPANPLTKEEHIEHFHDCMSYARKPLPVESIAQIIAFIDELEKIRNVCDIVPLMLSA